MPFNSVSPLVEPSSFDAAPEWVQDVMSLYTEFDASKAELLRQLYADEVVFTDPIHQVAGIGDLENYFKHISQGLSFCEFEFFDTCAVDDCAWLKWVMRFSHPRLGAKKVISISGATELKRHKKIYSHTDFYDLGAMLYEHVPILGQVTKVLKQRLANR